MSVDVRWPIQLSFIVAAMFVPRAATADPPKATCSLEIRLIDDSTGEPLAGVVRLRTADGTSIAPAELVNRGQGIEQTGPIHDWSVIVKPTKVALPAAPLTFAAFSGLETELASGNVDLAGKANSTLTIPLRRFYHARQAGHVAGNTHLHLMKLTKKQADRYLAEVPLADGLDVVFLSYLERAEADLDYTSNKYTPAELKRLSHDHLHFGHGEEHRHNFGSHGEGYGHILLLDIPYIIQPVSIGPGIMRRGADSPPLQFGHRKSTPLGRQGHLGPQPLRFRGHSELGHRASPRQQHFRRQPPRQLSGYVLSLSRYWVARPLFDRHRLVHLRPFARVRRRRSAHHPDRMARSAGAGQIDDHQRPARRVLTRRPAGWCRA